MLLRQRTEHRAQSAELDEFKMQVLAECRQMGASVAALALALAHGMNVSLVRKWLVGRALNQPIDDANLGRTIFHHLYTSEISAHGYNAFVLKYRAGRQRVNAPDVAADEPPAFAVAGKHDAIAPPAAMRKWIAALRKAGIEVEYHEYPGVGYGFGLRVGTSAQGRIAHAVRFWCQQARGSARTTTAAPRCAAVRRSSLWRRPPAACDSKLERVKGIEPSYEAWEAAVLPLNYTRAGQKSTRSGRVAAVKSQRSRPAPQAATPATLAQLRPLRLARYRAASAFAIRPAPDSGEPGTSLHAPMLRVTTAAASDAVCGSASDRTAASNLWPTRLAPETSVSGKSTTNSSPP
jgi:Prolyl oligopeptidase family